ncbi:hypothetical protein L226DRAFT_455216 [Lentinus tigrinus ALCF2SS1-7]|nr:hypothetical protein L226DRAFT_455216 [Lentinus tigrinus ALCF2SS1-7]
MCPTPSPQSQPRAYVDHNGDLHDPDYRDFPVLAARPNSRASDNHKRRRTSASSAARSRSHDRYSIGMHPPRPKWERDWGTEVDSDEDDEYEEAESQSHFSPFASQHGSPRKHTSHSAFSRPTYTSTYYYFDAPPTGSPVGSLEDESPNALQLHESPFDDDAVAEEVIEESRKAACLIRRASKPKKSVEVEVEKEIVQPSPITIEEEEYEDEQGSTPTCSHILRQQWQAVTLRIRFGVFHAKRRLFTRRRRT